MHTRLYVTQRKPAVFFCVRACALKLVGGATRGPGFSRAQLAAGICADESESSSHVILSLARSQLLQRMKYAIRSKCVLQECRRRGRSRKEIAEAAVALGYSQLSPKQAQALLQAV